MVSLTEELYLLSKHAGINIEDSLKLVDFEREAYVNLVLRDMKREMENMK